MIVDDRYKYLMLVGADIANLLKKLDSQTFRIALEEYKTPLVSYVGDLTLKNSWDTKVFIYTSLPSDIVHLLEMPPKRQAVELNDMGCYLPVLPSSILSAEVEKGDPR